jgi:methionyl-tRNA formyltransferase
VFLGTPDFAVPGLKALLGHTDFSVKAVVTQPDRPVGRGAKLLASPVKQVALEAGIPVLQPQSIKKVGKAFLEQLGQVGPLDLGVVIAFGQILPTWLLDFPACGCVNVHASLLPRWRGAAPIHRALLAGDRETGVCLMKMDAGLDTGPVFTRHVIPITETQTGGELHDALASLGAQALKTELAKIVRGEIPAVTQPDDGVTYASKIDPAEFPIDWNQPVEAVARKVRAFAPAPGAYTTVQNERLKIFDASPIEPPSRAADTRTGKIVAVGPDSFTVQCADGGIEVREVQMAGRKRLPVRDFLKGHTIQVGQQVGAS